MTTQNNGSMTALEAGLEAVLFAAGDAVTIERLSAALEAAPAELLDAAAALENRYDFENRGIMLLRIEDKLQLASRPMYGPYVRRVTESRRPPALSPAALEVLTIIAYRQPVTRAFIDQLRGRFIEHGEQSGGKGAHRGGRAAGRARKAHVVPHDRPVPAQLFTGKHRGPSGAARA